MLRIAILSGSVNGCTHSFTGTEPSGAPSAVTWIVPEYSPGAVSRGMYTSAQNPWFVPGSMLAGSGGYLAAGSPPAIGISASGYQPVGALERGLGLKTLM
ncbi:MAG: hypothetical protein MUF25_29305 [Pirellulaceae bacterium]|nr:hypothetical protein [Pirellulaceae bacterium]